MNTMSAFYMGQAARASGSKMTYFDGVKIKKLLEKHKVKKGEIYLGGDRGYTETTVKITKKGLEAEGIGVDGSIWATPMLDIHGSEYDVGTENEKRMNIKWL